MPGLLDHRLLVVTGKGGVGKTTIAAALALAAAGRGRPVIVVELGEQGRVARLFARPEPEPGALVEIGEGVRTITIDPDRALLEWLQALGGRVSGRILASSGTFQYFAAAAPGAKELVSMMKIAQLARDQGRGRRRQPPVVILDAPATGHVLGLLGSPRTFGAIARVGPIVRQTDRVRELLGDPAQSAYLAVATGSEMAVTEVLELEQGLRETLGRGLDGVLANALLPRRFSAAELARVEGLVAPGGGSPGARAGRPGEEGGPERDPGGDGVTRADGGEVDGLGEEGVTGADGCEAALAAASRAARAVHTRGAAQQAQLARLRRRGCDVLTVPFQWVPEVGMAELHAIAGHLERRL